MTDHKPLINLFGMKDPSSRLLKFRLQLDEYDFKIIHIPGNQNVVADALSRVIITSDELKNLQENVSTAMVMTRAQTRRQKEKEEEEEGSSSSSRNITIPSIPTYLRPDQPRIVEILRKTNDSVEIKFLEGKDIDKLKNLNKITKESQSLAFVESEMTIYINLTYMSHFTRAVFANMLCSFCKDIGVEEVCIIKCEKN